MLWDSGLRRWQPVYRAYSYLPMPPSPTWCRRSAGGSSVSYATWDTWRRASTPPWPQGMLPSSTTRPSSRAPWPPPCSSASPVASGPDKQCAILDRALGMQGNSPPGPPLCQCQRVFAPCKHPGPSPSAGSAGALAPLTARDAVALARRAEDANGDLVSTFTTPWADGTTGITLAPLELLEKLAALVPLPRVHLVR